MPKRLSRTVSNMKQRAKRQRISSLRNKKLINGRPAVGGGVSSKVLRASSVLVGNEAQKPANPRQSVGDISIDVLNTIGCTLTDDPADMSLLTLQTDKEIIWLDRPELTVDGRPLNSLNGIRGKNITAFDKFREPRADPFYILDKGPFQAQQLVMDQQLKQDNREAITLVGFLYDLNLADTNSLSIKYFLSIGAGL
jgi:hypothetical protein